MTQLLHAVAKRRVGFLLVPLALIFVAPYVALLFGQFFEMTGGNHLPPVPGAILGTLTFPFVLTAFADAYLLGQALSYLLVSGLVLLICALIIRRGATARTTRIAAGVVIVCVLAVPLAFRRTPTLTLLNDRGFTPYAVPSQQTFVDGTVDGLLGSVEMKGCRYDVLGWSDDNILYYSADCFFTPPAFWRFDTAEPDHVTQVAQVPDRLMTTSTPFLYESLHAIRSPDGRWIASVWEKFDYDPENVIVVEAPA